MNTKKFLITAAVFIVAVIILVMYLFRPTYLILEDAKSGTEYLKYPVKNLDHFSVTFVHSVNKSPVTDIYEIRDGEIYLIETVYYGFGAGVPTELYRDETFSFGDNGELIISNMDTLIPNLIYVVGTVSDHTFSLNDGDEISLRDLCGKNSSVKFHCTGFSKVHA